MKKDPDLILASSSPYRQALLSRLQLPFECHAPDIDETPFENESFDAHVKRLSLAKAHVIAARYPQARCIGSDAIATLDSTIIGKPLTHDNAVAQLTRMSGQTVTFYTGVALVHRASHYEDYQLATTKITFRSLTREMIEDYLHKEKPYFSAGSIKSEALGIALISRFKAEDPTALMGLPLMTLTSMLEASGMPVL